MIEHVAYLAAQRLTAGLARQARPGAPAQPAPIAASQTVPLIHVRRRIILALHRLADRVGPAANGAPCQ